MKRFKLSVTRIDSKGFAIISDYEFDALDSEEAILLGRMIVHQIAEFSTYSVVSGFSLNSI